MPHKVLERYGDAYKLDIPTWMKLHPVFYVGRLKSYQQSTPENIQEYDRLPIVQGDQSSDISRFDSSENTRIHLGADDSPPRTMNDTFGGNPPNDGRANDNPRPLILRSSPPLIDSLGENRYVVEYIDSHKMMNGSIYYRVKWMGYPLSMRFWEPYHILIQDIPDLVQEYRKDHIPSSSLMKKKSVVK